MAPVDADELVKLKAELDADPARALQWLFPAGRLIRNEFQVGAIDGTAGRGLAFNVRKLTGKDFKSGAKGFSNVLDVFVAKAGGSFPGGLDLARQYAGVPEAERPKPEKGKAKGRKDDSDAWTQIIPPAAGIGRPDFARLWPNAHFRKAWAYRDAAGGLLFHVARYELEEVGEDGKTKIRKVTPAVTWGFGEDGRRRWRAKGKALDILFGLEQLAARPNAPVLVVEGEKAAEAARLLFPAWVVLAWKGGSGNARNIDVTPLTGRDVVLWPDADHAGYGAMEAISRAALKAGADVRLVRLPDGLPDGWDLADDLPDGWTADTLEGLLTGAEVRGRRRRLPAYYPAPAEPRAAALNRQRQVIGGWFRIEAKLVRARKEAAGRSAALIEATGLNDEALKAYLSDRQIAARKAVISRKVNKQVAAEHGVERLSRKESRLLVTGAQGSGKSRAAGEEIAELDAGTVVWWTVPTIDKAEEQAAEYTKLARPGSLPALVVRGRGQDDPHQRGKAMCPRHKAVNRAAARGVEVRKQICKVCPLQERCGYLKQESEISAMDGGLFLMAREYAFMPSPAPAPDIFIGDESLIPVAAAEPVEFQVARIRETGNWKAAGLDAVLDVMPTLEAVYRAADDQPGRILEALRNAGISQKQIAEAISYLDKAGGAAAAAAITGRMSDAEIDAALDQFDLDDIGNVIRFLRQIRREWNTGRAGLNTVAIAGGVVKVFGLKAPRIAKSVPILLLDGTGSAALNRVLFGELVHEHIPVERRAHVTGTKGKSYSRQSITGRQAPTKTNPDGLPFWPAEAERLRHEIAGVVRRLDGPVFVCATKRAEEALAPDLPGIAMPGHFSAVRGINAWEKCRTAVVVGREKVWPQRLEEMARPFMVADAEPFQAFGFYVKTTRGRRMRSGAVVPLEVEVHPDIRCQEMLEQIREAEIVQTGDRVRPIFNERSIVLMNELVLDVTYDRILSHEELVMGGNRYERAWSEKGILPAGARDLHRLFPQLWTTEKAARQELSRNAPTTPTNQIIDTIWFVGVVVEYRIKGYSGPASRAWIDPQRHPNQRAALESLLGPLSHFEVVQPPAEQKATAPAMDADVLKLQAPGKPLEVPAPELSTPALTVMPPRPTPADELARMQAILGQAGRLAGLSSRLEAAYQRLRPPDLPERRAAL